MKKILYLLLISSPIFSMQPDHTTTNKLQEKLVTHENKRFTYTQMAVAYATMPSIIPTPIPLPWTITDVAIRAAIVGIGVAADKIDMHMQNKNNK